MSRHAGRGIRWPRASGGTAARLASASIALATLWAHAASAGMPSVTLADIPRAARAATRTGLTDVARQGFEVISFFLLGLLA